MPWRATAIVAYVACLVIAFAILNADYEDWPGAFAVALIGGVILALGMDFWTSAGLTLLAPAVGALFGYPEKHLGSEAPDLWITGMVLMIPFLLGASLVGALLRKLWAPSTRPR